MIRLRRGPPPQPLVRHGAKWAARWLAIHRGEKTGDWATPKAKRLLGDELQRLTHGKCAFCESLLGVTSYLEVEHYTPKTVDPAHVFAWDNLFPVCRYCNGAKGDIDHNGMLLKPDVEDPQDLLWLNP